MSQRNPMNDRYQSDVKGQTKKSAASMKPKSKAAASVYIKPSGHTPGEEGHQEAAACETGRTHACSTILLPSAIKTASHLVVLPDCRYCLDGARHGFA
ncbi:MAG: hypothetical protein ACLTQI_06310 [Slackia sp.]